MDTIQINSTLEKKLVYNILQYLNSFTRENESGLHVDTEGLEVAVQCISAAFDLNLNDEQLRTQYSIEPLSLPHIFGLGLAGKQQLEAFAQEQILKEQSSVVVPHEQSKVPKELEDKFKAFVGVLEKKDFFKGVEPGSEAYRARLSLAEEKFLARASQPVSLVGLSRPEIDPSVTEEAERLKIQGNELLTAKKIQDAIVCYDKAVTLNPNNPVYFANRAAAFSQLGNHEKAIFDCKSAIDLDPKYSKAYSRLGFSLFSLGKYKEAIELGYKKCLELDPDNPTAKDSLLLAQEKLEEEERLKQRERNIPPPAVPPQMPPGMDQLLSSPDIQGAMQNLAQQFPGLAGGGGGGGVPPNPFQGGGGGGGGQPSLTDLLNNPAVMNMAQQVMNSPAFSQILQNPAFMNMAQGMMQNPGGMESLLRGMGSENKEEEK